MSILEIPTPRAFAPLLHPARYKGAHGGRGSGKSHFFAELLVEDALRTPGLRAVCIREVQKTLKESAKRLIEDKIQALNVGRQFNVLTDRIETPGGGVIIFQGMQDHTAESIKSLEGFQRAWVEEAQTLSARSLTLLRPTLRAEDSEIWASWNPRRKTDAIDEFLRGKKPENAIVVEANWRDNPWFPGVLQDERLLDREIYPDRYEHVWEGAYATAFDGAYFAKCLTEAKAQGRIGRVAADPLMTYRAYWDIGGTGAKADACAIWIAQIIGREIRVLDYHEAVGQPLAYHVQWLRKNGYEAAHCYLPHDGVKHDSVYQVTYESALREADFDVTVIPNQGAGAAMQRIEAARRRFPMIWFNEATTEAGRDALGYYHEKKDEARNVGLGPDHDWSSHGCFHPSTKLLTRYGTCRIDSLPDTGEVLTPCGWKQYVAPRITKRDAPLVEVAFVGGHSVRCTPDHLFLTASGWRSAESLTPDTLIQSTSTSSPNTSTAGCIGRGLARLTSHVAASDCTATRGPGPSAPSLPGVISTIATRTFSTIASTIWSASPLASTCPSLGVGASGPMVAGSAMTRETAPRTGTAQKRAGSGIRDTLKAHKAGPSGSAKRSRASTAAQHILRWSAKAATQANTAANRARLLLTGRAGSPMNMPVVIASVRPLSETSDVWDITVPDGHWFSLENGAVVHNSDAFGLMCVAYEEPRKADRLVMPNFGAV